MVKPSAARVAQEAVVWERAEVPSNANEKLEIELRTRGELQFADAAVPPPVLWMGEEVIALTPNAACAGAETKMGAIKAKTAVIT
jgi:hypothetical protein